VSATFVSMTFVVAPPPLLKHQNHLSRHVNFLNNSNASITF
jgi:hypothetical protein